MAALAQLIGVIVLVILFGFGIKHFYEQFFKKDKK